MAHKSDRRLAIRLPALRSWVWVLALLLAAVTGGGFVLIDYARYFIAVGVFIGWVAICATVGFARINGLRVLLAMLMLAAPPSFTLLIHGEELHQYYTPLGVAALGFSSYWLASRIRDEEWRIIFKLVPAISVGLYAFGMAVLGHTSFTIEDGARITPGGMHPIVCGITVISICILGAANQSRKWAAFTFAFCLTACILANARGAMLTVVCMGAVWLWMDLKERRRFGVAIYLALFGVGIGLIFLPFITAVAGDVITTVLQLNNTGRGINSGFSGRADIWDYYTGVWLKEPIFGAGTTQNYQSIQGVMPAHDLYLGLLVGSGLVGLTLFMLYMAWVCWNAFSNRHIGKPLKRVSTMAVVAYLISGLFEARGTNIGNAMSVVFFFCTFAALGKTDLKIWTPSVRQRPRRVSNGAGSPASMPAAMGRP